MVKHLPRKRKRPREDGGLNKEMAVLLTGAVSQLVSSMSAAESAFVEKNPQTAPYLRAIIDEFADCAGATLNQVKSEEEEGSDDAH
jgi:hypothetical protein